MAFVTSATGTNSTSVTNPGVAAGDLVVVACFTTPASPDPTFTLVANFTRPNGQGTGTWYAKTAAGEPGFWNFGAGAQYWIVCVWRNTTFAINGAVQSVGGLGAPNTETLPAVANALPNRLNVTVASATWYTLGGTGPIGLGFDAGLTSRATNGDGSRDILGVADEFVTSGAVPARTETFSLVAYNSSDISARVQRANMAQMTTTPTPPVLGSLSPNLRIPYYQPMRKAR